MNIFEIFESIGVQEGGLFLPVPPYLLLAPPYIT